MLSDTSMPYYLRCIIVKIKRQWPRVLQHSTQTDWMLSRNLNNFALSKAQLKIASEILKCKLQRLYRASEAELVRSHMSWSDNKLCETRITPAELWINKSLWEFLPHILTPWTKCDFRQTIILIICNLAIQCHDSMLYIIQLYWLKLKQKGTKPLVNLVYLRPKYR